MSQTLKTLVRTFPVACNELADALRQPSVTNTELRERFGEVVELLEGCAIDRELHSTVRATLVLTKHTLHLEEEKPVEVGIRNGAALDIERLGRKVTRHAWV